MAVSYRHVTFSLNPDDTVEQVKIIDPDFHHTYQDILIKTRQVVISLKILSLLFVPYSLLFFNVIF